MEIIDCSVDEHRIGGEVAVLTALVAAHPPESCAAGTVSVIITEDRRHRVAIHGILARWPCHYVVKQLNLVIEFGAIYSRAECAAGPTNNRVVYEHGAMRTSHHMKTHPTALCCCVVVYKILQD